MARRHGRRPIACSPPQNAACSSSRSFVAVLDLSSGVLRYCNAGHNPPYMLRAQGGARYAGRTGIPFGIDATCRIVSMNRAPSRRDALFSTATGSPRLSIPKARNSAPGGSSGAGGPDAAVKRGRTRRRGSRRNRGVRRGRRPVRRTHGPGAGPGTLSGGDRGTGNRPHLLPRNPHRATHRRVGKRCEACDGICQDRAARWQS